MAAIDIRLLGPGDAALLAAADPDVFDDPVDPALAQGFLDDPRHHIVAAIADGQIVGFASGVHYIHPDKPAEFFVNECGVAESWQRRGLARRVMQGLFDHARSLGCTVAWLGTERSNTAAMALYRGLGGFEPLADAVHLEFDLTRQD